MNWLLLTLISAVFGAIFTLLLKRDLYQETNTQVIAIYSLVATLILPLFGHIDFHLLFTSVSWLILLKVAAIALAIFCNTLALEHLPVSIYAPLRNISPLFLLILGAATLGEVISLSQVVGLLLLITGAILLDIDVRQPRVLRQLRSFATNPAVLLLILSAVSISFAPLFDRLILKQTDALTNVWWYYALLTLIFWTLHLIRERKLPTVGLRREEWALLLLTGVVVALGDYSIVSAIALPGTILVVIIGVRRLSNLFATIFGGTLFHEGRVLYKSAMCLLMIIGTVLLVL